jgi:hypothetical protein
MCFYVKRENMRSPKTKLSFIISCIMIYSTYSFGQSVREPNAAEKKVFDKTIPIIVSVLDRFGNNDWTLDQDWYNGDPLVPTDYDDKGPIGIDQNFERDYVVKQDSKRFNEIIKPLYDKTQVLSDKLVAKMKEYEKNPPKNNEMEKDPLSDSLDALNNKLQELNELHVYAYINRANISGRPATDVQVKGNAMVTKTDEGYMANDYFKSYYIAFGDWKSSKWNADDNLYDFKFKNTKTPSIQNIVIIMTGARDRMKELMNKLDWSVLNKAIIN